MVLALFLFLLGFGLLLLLHAAPPRDVGVGFWRMITLIAGIPLIFAARLAWDTATVRALLTTPAGSNPDYWRGVNALTFAAYATGALIAGLLAWLNRETAARRALEIANAVGIAAVAGFGAGLGSTHGLARGATALVIGALLTSALVLGSAVGGMLLGHWYLVRPAMEIRHLQVFSGVIIGSLALRLALSVTVGIASLGPGLTYGGSQLEWLVDMDPLTLLVRAAFGLLGPIVLSGMIWQTVKLRATQPATGLLYACVVFVLAGELSGAYLLLTRHVPL